VRNQFGPSSAAQAEVLRLPVRTCRLPCPGSYHHCRDLSRDCARLESRQGQRKAATFSRSGLAFDHPFGERSQGHNAPEFESTPGNVLGLPGRPCTKGGQRPARSCLGLRVSAHGHRVVDSSRWQFPDLLHGGINVHERILRSGDGRMMDRACRSVRGPFCRPPAVRPIRAKERSCERYRSHPLDQVLREVAGHRGRLVPRGRS